MRADVTGPAARRALGAVYAAAAAHLSDDLEGLDLVLGDALASSPLEDLVDASLITAAELFDQIARTRGLLPERLASVLAAAVTDLVPGPLSASMEALKAYSAGEMEQFDALCGLLSLHGRPALDAVVSVLAGAVRWTARDQDVDPAVLARSLCLRVAQRQSTLG